VLSDNLAERNQVRGNASVGVDWLIRDIGKISAAFTTDFLRFLTEWNRSTDGTRTAYDAEYLVVTATKVEPESLK